VVADDLRWAATSRGAPQRPAGASVPQLMLAYQIGRIGLLKVDIEGGEFGVFGSGEDLRWLDQVDQVVMEIHPGFGDAVALIGVDLTTLTSGVHERPSLPGEGSCARQSCPKKPRHRWA
jgi:hypothetical protein